MQDKDTLVTAVKNDIVFADRVGRDGFDQGFIASRDKEWVHTVALWSDADDVAVLKQSFKIRSGGSPTCTDRVYASMMGSYAVDLLAEGKTNRVVGYRNGEFTDFDIDEALAMQKSISEYMYDVSKALSI